MRDRHPPMRTTEVTALLAHAGMDEPELRRIGAVRAYERVRAIDPGVTIETFYALQVAARTSGAITKVPSGKRNSS